MFQGELLWFLREFVLFDGFRRVSKTKVVRDVPPLPPLALTGGMLCGRSLGWHHTILGFHPRRLQTRVQDQSHSRRTGPSFLTGSKVIE